MTWERLPSHPLAPGFHNFTPLLQVVRPSVRPLDAAADGVTENGFSYFMGSVGGLCNPVAQG